MPSNIAKVEKLFKSPGTQPNGIQAAEDGLWIIDQNDLKIYRVDYETGDVLFEAQTDTEHSSGITLGGGFIWIASTFELKIAKVDPETGKSVEKYDSPGAGITAPREGIEGARATGSHGLEWKDGKLYVATPPSQMVHVMNVETWEEEHQFRTPGFRNHGVAWGDNERVEYERRQGTSGREYLHLAPDLRKQVPGRSLPIPEQPGDFFLAHLFDDVKDSVRFPTTRSTENG